jgi:hypothetical protein
VNFPQRIVLALGAIIIAGMVLFPPWLFIYTEPAWQSNPLDKFGSGGHGEQRIERPAGYQFLFGPHLPPSDHNQLGAIFGLPAAPPWWVIMQIDVRQLGVQLGGVLVVTTLLTLLLKSRK